MDINSVHVCGPFIHTLTFFPFFRYLDDAPTLRRARCTAVFMMLMSTDCYPVDLLCPTRPLRRHIYFVCLFIFFFHLFPSRVPRHNATEKP